MAYSKSQLTPSSLTACPIEVMATRLEPPVYVLVGRRQVEPKLLLIGAQGLYTSAPATPTTWGVSTVPNSCKAVRSSTLYHELPEDFTILPVAASTSCILTQSLSRIYILSFSASYTAAPIGEGTLVTTPGVQKRSFSRFQLKNRTLPPISSSTPSTEECTDSTST